MNHQIFSHSYFFACRQLLFTAAVLLALPITVQANPRSDAPDTPLVVHGTIKGAEEEVKRLYDLHAAEEKLVINFYSQLDKPESLPYQQISASAGKVWLAIRDAEHLKLMGEPAAVDLQHKLTLLGKIIHHLANKYSQTAPGTKYKLKLLDQLSRKKPDRDRQLLKAQQMISGGQLESAEKQLQSLGVELWEQCVFFTSVDELRPSWNQFQPVIGNLDPKLRAKRRALYQGQAMQVAAGMVAESRAFEKEATRVRGELSSSGKATLEGERQGNAVEAFEYIAGRWSHSSALLMRSQAIIWAFAGDDGSGGIRAADTEPAKQEVSRLSESAKQAFSSLIGAATDSTPSDQIVPTYASLLQQISIVNRRMTGDGITSSCDEALKRFASKNTTLAGQAERYTRATSEAMLWRARFAAQQAERLVKDYSSISSQMASRSVLTKSNRPAYSKPPITEMLITPGMFYQPANWMVYEAAALLLGKTVSDQTMLRLTPTSKTAVVPYLAGSVIDRGQYGSHYTNVPVPIPIDAETAELRRFLIVDENHPPLSIDAADAISSAELQDFERIGGMVARLHLEATVTRFVALPDVAYVLSPLGRLPILTSDATPLSQTCWRFDVIPHWVQHKCFTVQVVAAAQ